MNNISQQTIYIHQNGKTFRLDLEKDITTGKSWIYLGGVLDEKANGVHPSPKEVCCDLAKKRRPINPQHGPITITIDMVDGMLSDRDIEDCFSRNGFDVINSSYPS